jgi:alpha-L-arabinofuranosidase
MADWRRRARSELVLVSLIAAVLAAGPGAHSAARAIPTGPSEVVVRVVVGQRPLGKINPGLFGSNLLWPYNAEGAFDPATHSFYPAFVSEVRDLGVTAIRYPAGITADSFDWLRAIGPERLPNEPYGMQAASFSDICCELDTPVPSTVGPDEFGDLLGQTGSIGDVVVNFATGTADEAADFVAYMTAPYGEQPSSSPSDPGFWAALRAENGHPAPFNVPYWEVGNEQDGPGQTGWRSGTLVSMGPHQTPCPTGDQLVCLYAFGGTTAFYDQTVGTFADELQSASYSTGSPDQTFYVYYPPVVPSTQTVYVNGQIWREVQSLSAAGPDDDVYEFDASKGEITFGDGMHGAVPPAGALIMASYESGPHGGFVQYYRAMKAMDPDAQICETEESNTAFLELMGRTYPYDCVELHKYAKPLDIQAPITAYEEELMSSPIAEGAKLSALQSSIRHYSGKNIPVVLTEYGQLIRPMPVADPAFNLSLDEGLLVGSQLRQWIIHYIPLAEKYLLVSTPFLSQNTVNLSLDPVGLSIDSAMIAGPGPSFVVEPTGQVLGLMRRLAGKERLNSHVRNDPLMGTGPDGNVPVLQPIAASSNGKLYLLVLNVSPITDVNAEISLWRLARQGDVTATLLNGPSPTAFNTAASPATVTTVTRTVLETNREFSWIFPAHSVTLLEMPIIRPGIYPV